MAELLELIEVKYKWLNLAHDLYSLESWVGLGTMTAYINTKIHILQPHSNLVLQVLPVVLQIHPLQLLGIC